MLTRFGRENLQIEVYVTELLKLVLCNATSKSKLELVILYDLIETHIRALDTLGITSDKCSAMLFPLIESCLPQDSLRAWQRSPHRFEPENSGSAISTESGPGKLDTRLMKFLKTEVENDQRITLATEGFGFVGQGNASANLSRTVSSSSAKKNVSSPVPTATNFVSFDSNCAFCVGSNHIGEHCFKAQKMTLEQKKRILISNNICFRCLKAGHTSKRCRGHPRCALCQKSHLVIMSPDLPINLKSFDTLDHSKKPEVDPNIDKSLATYNNSRTHVFLQTMRVNIFGANGSKYVRALIDSGSQRSYILKSTAEKLGCQSVGKEKLIHCLFGGSQNERLHECYVVKLKNQNYSYNLEVLDQPIICSEVSPVYSGPWIEELRDLNIELSDIGSAGPIEILIGADSVGQIFTGNRHSFSNGLVAYETLFGWVLLGKIPMHKM
ncbi:uncharacterized protein [Leptinotarsa decemlineata]|uniref:uncharacterized protein n=1 Tax=Leptinotarsa decemlineata TaxID=7539 RepID=UPI003D305FD8